jgi:hypothetical protein
MDSKHHVAIEEAEVALKAPNGGARVRRARRLSKGQLVRTRAKRPAGRPDRHIPAWPAAPPLARYPQPLTTPRLAEAPDDPRAIRRAENATAGQRAAIPCMKINLSLPGSSRRWPLRCGRGQKVCAADPWRMQRRPPNAPYCRLSPVKRRQFCHRTRARQNTASFRPAADVEEEEDGFTVVEGVVYPSAAANARAGWKEWSCASHRMASSRL